MIDRDKLREALNRNEPPKIIDCQQTSDAKLFYDAARAYLEQADAATEPVAWLVGDHFANPPRVVFSRKEAIEKASGRPLTPLYAAPHADGWRDDIESAPKDGTEFDAFNPMIGVCVARWSNKDGFTVYWWDDMHAKWYPNLTHWRPRPAPPVMKGKME